MQLTTNQILRKAKEHADQGNAGEAEALYRQVLENSPGNRRATEGLADLYAESPETKQSNSALPRHVNKPASSGLVPREKIDRLMVLFNQGFLSEVIREGEHLLKQFPELVVLYSLVGASYARQDQMLEASEIFRKAFKVAPKTRKCLTI